MIALLALLFMAPPSPLPSANVQVVRLDAAGPLAPAVRAELDRAGFSIDWALGGGAYLARYDRASGPLPQRVADRTVGVRAWRDVDKLQAALRDGRVPPWALRFDRDPRQPWVAVAVVFAPHTSRVTIDEQLALHGATVIDTLTRLDAVVTELPLAAVALLAGAEAVVWIEPLLPSWQTVNDANRAEIQADAVQDPPYGLSGSGIAVLVYDAGVADATHPDLVDRVVAGDNGPPHFHATHVAGTLAGTGALSGGLWRGMAPGATVHSYTFTFDLAGGNLQVLYANPGDLEADYLTAIDEHGVVLASNSIGTNVCFNSQIFGCDVTGNYGVTSALIDGLVSGAGAAPLTVLWAAGNERGCDACTGAGGADAAGYHSIAPPAGSKNAIVVGASDADSGAVTPFSSWGPLDDGRLKPDLVAPGCQTSADSGVTSTCSTAAGGLPPCGDAGPGAACCTALEGPHGYGALCGTSMATPTAAGAAALLLEDAAQRWPLRPPPRPAWVKAMLLHTAQDIEQPGPDYRSGFGVLRIRDAVDHARTEAFDSTAVAHGAVQRYFVDVAAGDPELRATVVWDDAPGFPGALQALVNDLDLTAVAPDGTVVLPATLDPDQPDAPATAAQPDRLNNVEQVRVVDPAPGRWELHVTGWSIPTGGQSFTLTATPRLAADCDGNGQPDGEQIAADPGLDCTSNGRLDACEPDCNANGLADSCDLAAGTSTDCNGNFIADDCEAGGAVDCDADGVVDLCAIAEGLSTDCNTNNTPDTCEPGGLLDCNDNGGVDFCDIAQGGSTDFNSNGMPDECEGGPFTWHVDAAACPGPGAGSIGDPFCTIAAAITAALSGDAIRVAPGTYGGSGNRGLDFGGRLLDLTCTGAAGSCVLDGGGIERLLVLDSGEPPGTRVAGFTLQNGRAADGGAVLVAAGAAPRLEDCILTGNTATGSFGGGAAHVVGADPRFERCTFLANVAQWDGGAVYCVDGRPVFEDCTVQLNNATQGNGAGLYFAGQSHAVVRRCRVQNNHTLGPLQHGGGIYCFHSSLALAESRVGANSTAGCGGAVYSWLGTLDVRSSLIINNSAVPVDGQSGCGGGLFSNTASFALRHCTLLGNAARHGGGIYATGSGTTTLQGSIAHGNTATLGAQLYLSAFASLQAADDIIAGGADAVHTEAGAGVVWQTGPPLTDPQFFESAIGGYHLALGSPAVDGGDPAAVIDVDERDVDGRPRRIGPSVDIGAAEFDPLDCNHNGAPDADDIAAGAADCDHSGVPDACEADCNANGVHDTCDVAQGTSVDCDADGIPDECAAALQDCDGNGVPDPCDLLAAPDADCDGNATLDVCDLALGAADFNGNGVLDVCERSVRAWYVDDDAAGDPGPGDALSSDPAEDGSSAHPYDTIQEAIDRALDGDVVAVRAGHYRGPGNRNLDCGGRSLTIRGLDGPHATVVDGQGVAPVMQFRSGEPPSTAVIGLTLTGGHGTGGAATIRAGSQPRFSRCILRNNTGVTGGAVALWGGASAVFENCIVVGNHATNTAGALYITGATAALRHCTVALNESAPANPAVVVALGALDVQGSVIAGNGAIGAPQLGLVASLAQIRTTLIPGGQNALAVDAGSTLVWDASNMRAVPQFLDADHGNVRLAPGSPGIDGGPLEHGFAKGARDVDGRPRVLDGAIDLGAAEFDPDCDADGARDVDQIAAGHSPDCNANGVPDTCEDCDGDGVADSCAIATGTPDCDANGVPDGCQPGGLADCDGDGVSNLCALAAGVADCNGNHLPDDCSAELDCNANGVPDGCDVAAGSVMDCDHNGVPDGCDIAADPANDCNGNGAPDGCDRDCDGSGTPDDCDIANGVLGDCDGNGTPDLCEPDCDGSGAADVCEILAGVRGDCDGNGVLDICQSGWGLDCNGNARTDFCDIAGGTHADANANAVPDDCEPHLHIYVDALACPAVGGGTPTDPFCRIQDGLDAAPDGSAIVVTVHVAAGVYSGTGNTLLQCHGKALTVRGSGQQTTVLDGAGDGPVWVMDGSEGPGTVVRALTVRGGVAPRGAGMVCEGGGPTLLDLTFSDHTATVSGGALYCDQSSPRIERCRFADNHAVLNGGAVFVVGGSPRFDRTWFTGNSAAASGGAFSCLAGATVLRNCVLRGNSAVASGGAITTRSSGDVVVLTSTVVQNSAAVGGGLFVETSAPQSHGSIWWGNMAESGGQFALGNAAQLDVTFSVVMAGAGGITGTDIAALTWGEGNHVVAPGLQLDGVHIGASSVCIDGGPLPWSTARGERDIDGSKRVFGGRVDIGADEFHPGPESPTPPAVGPQR